MQIISSERTVVRPTKNLSTGPLFCLQVEFVVIASLAKNQPGAWDVDKPKCKGVGLDIRFRPLLMQSNKNKLLPGGKCSR